MSEFLSPGSRFGDTNLPVWPVFCSYRVARHLFFVTSDEVAHFVSATQDEISRFVANAFDLRCTEQIIEDSYFDTVGRDFRSDSASLRIREYPEQQSEGQFDIVWLEWEDGRLTDHQELMHPTRRHRAVVQTCDTAGGVRAEVLARYSTLGYERVLSVRKRRHTFVLRPASVIEFTTPSPAGRLSSTRNRMRVSRHVDSGLRVMVDACFLPDARTIVEVEFGQAHGVSARAVIQSLLEQFRGRLYPKRHNKIVYALDRLLMPGHESEIGSRRDSAPQWMLGDVAHLADSRCVWEPRGVSTGQMGHKPGLGLKLKETWLRPIVAMNRAVTVRVPGRLHCAIWNNKKVSSDLPGGGGFGISTSSVETVIDVSVASEEHVPGSPSVEHLIALFSRLLDYDPNRLSIRIRSSHPFVQSGFGSNICLNTGVALGLNALFRMPFSVSEVSEIVGLNYVENYDGALVRPGHDTGVGFAALLRGGFVWLSEDGQFKGHMDPGVMYAVTALGPQYTRDVETANPKDSSARPRDEQEYFDFARRFAAQRLWPSFAAGQRDEFLSRAREMRDKWVDAVSAEYCDRAMLRKWIELVETCGALYSGLSSEGPLLFALFCSRAKAINLAWRLRHEFAGKCSEFRVARVGLPLRIEM